MAKGIEQRKNVKKKPAASLKEKRAKKREKKLFHSTEHMFDQ